MRGIGGTTRPIGSPPRHRAYKLRGMDIDPRAALDRLVEALTTHYEAVVTTQDSESPAVLRATEVLEEAFVAYDDSLFTHFDADLPFDIYDDEDADDDDDDDDDFDDFDEDDLDDDDGDED